MGWHNAEWVKRSFLERQNPLRRRPSAALRIDSAKNLPGSGKKQRLRCAQRGMSLRDANSYEASG